MLASGTDANADRIPLPPSINLTIGDQHELGKVQPATPEGNAAITQYVNFMIGLSLGGSDHVIIGPHNVLVTRSTNDFGQLPGPATLALRGTDTTVNLGLTGGTYDYLLAHYGGPGGVSLKCGMSAIWAAIFRFIPSALVMASPAGRCLQLRVVVLCLMVEPRRCCSARHWARLVWCGVFLWVKNFRVAGVKRVAVPKRERPLCFVRVECSIWQLQRKWNRCYRADGD